MRKVFAVFALVIAASVLMAGCSKTADNDKIPVKVLILSAFEVEEMAGDFPERPSITTRHIFRAVRNMKSKDARRILRSITRTASLWAFSAKARSAQP